MRIFQYFIYLPFTILMIIIMLFCVKKLSNKKIYSTPFKNILLVFLCLLLLLNNYYNKATLILPTAISISTVINILFFKLKIKDALKYTIIFYIIGIVSELLITLVLINSNFTSVEVLNNNTTIKTFLSLLENIVVLAVFSNKKTFKLIKKTEILMFSNINISYILVLVFVILNIITIFRNSNLNNVYIIFVTISCVIITLITLKVIINDKYNIKVLTDRNNNLKDSFRAYKETIEGYRIMKHNLKNELYSLKTSLPNQYQRVIDNLIIKNNNDTKWITEIGEIPEGIQGIIYLKKKEAEKRNVRLLIDTKKYTNLIDSDYIDLCDTVGILIDNAIEASSNVKYKIVDLSIKENENNLIIVIKNIFNNNIDINKIGKKNYSTKTIKSGIGLNYLNKMKNDRIDVKFDIVNNIFISRINYKITNKKLSK